MKIISLEIEGSTLSELNSIVRKRMITVRMVAQARIFTFQTGPPR